MAVGLAVAVVPASAAPWIPVPAPVIVPAGRLPGIIVALTAIPVPTTIFQALPDDFPLVGVREVPPVPPLQLPHGPPVPELIVRNWAAVTMALVRA